MCLVIKVLPHPNQTVKSSESSRQAGKMALPLQAPVPTTWSTWTDSKIAPSLQQGRNQQWQPSQEGVYVCTHGSLVVLSNL